MTYDPTTFWADPPPGVLGPWDPAHPDDSPAHLRQEAALFTVLDDGPPFLSVFEVGCGMGRLARFFAAHWPQTQYTAIDLGAAQLASARRFQPDGTFEHADLLDYWNTRAYDLVIASEVLMHVRPEDLDAAVNALRSLVKPSGRIVTVDWVPLDKPPPQIAYWNFPHDYDAAFREAGLTMVEKRRTDLQIVHVLIRG